MNFLSHLDHQILVFGTYHTFGFISFLFAYFYVSSNLKEMHEWTDIVFTLKRSKKYESMLK